MTNYLTADHLPLLGDAVGSRIPKKQPFIERYQSRFYLYTNNRWTAPNSSYGYGFVNCNLNRDTGVDPSYNWADKGFLLRAGECLKGLSLFGRTNNGEVSGIEIALAASTGPWAGAWDTNGETVTTEILREANLFPVAADHTRYAFDADFEAQDDTYLTLYVKPYGTLTGTRYLLLEHHYEILPA